MQDMKETHENLVRHLLKRNDVKFKWLPDYFPFTEPSFELQVYFEDSQKWIELLGCGVIHKNVINETKTKTSEQIIGWASGIGIERVAMLLYQIPDIRLFWSKDERFLDQFKTNKISKFVPFSKYPECRKDISFWVTGDFHQNDFFELVREIGKDQVETVQLIDSFTEPKKQKKSQTFRINFRSLERTLTNQEVNDMYFQLREEVAKKFPVQLR